jgi:hypothetical protein
MTSAEEYLRKLNILGNHLKPLFRRAYLTRGNSA